MRWDPSRLSLPLLAKELVEQAAQKRTYALRVVYASILYVVSLLFFHAEMVRMARYNQDPMWMLGRGEDLFMMVVALGFAGIFAFLPAMMAGAITTEKESGSLPLLFMTDLKPWELLLQKYVGRLIPMLTFLLLSVPLMGVAYAYGGVSPTLLAQGVMYLLLTALEVGAFALMCSALFRTTVGAILGSYLLGAAFYGALPFVAMIGYATGGFRMHDEDVVFALFPPYHFFDNPGSSRDWIAGLLLTAIPTLLFLLIARWCLVRRAFVRSRSLLGAFKLMDRFYVALNHRVGGITFLHDREPLPDAEPVAWRESHKRGLGRREHLFRIAVLLEVPTLLIGGWFAIANYGWQCDELTFCMIVAWAVAALLLTVQSVNVIAAERHDQTLDLLLATPLSAEDIVRQKMKALRRLMLVLSLPILTLAVLEAFAEKRHHEPSGYLLGAVLGVLVYMPLIAWTGLWIGLRVRQRLRAIMTAIVVVGLWICGVPVLWVLLVEVGRMLREFHDLRMLPLLLSPGPGVILNEVGEWRAFDVPASAAAIVHFALLGVAALTIRWLCLARADRYLRGRT